MNKIFKKVFNARRGKYVAVDETKTGHGQMGTCTVGGGSVKSSLEKAAVVGAMLAMGGTAIAAVPTTDVVSGNYTIALDQAAVSDNYQINQQDVSSLTVTGAGGTQITGYKKVLDMEYKVCNSNGCYSIDDVPETGWKKTAIKTAYNLALAAFNSLTTTKSTQPEADEAAEKLAQNILKLDEQDLARGYWLDVNYKNPDEKATPVEKDVAGEPVKATNLKENTLTVSGLTKLESEATLDNEGMISSVGGLSVDATSKLKNAGTFTTSNANGTSFGSVTSIGAIENGGTFIAGDMEVGKAINLNDLTNLDFNSLGDGDFEIGDLFNGNFDWDSLGDASDTLKSITSNSASLKNEGTLKANGTLSVNGNLALDGTSLKRDENAELDNAADKLVESDNLDAFLADIDNKGTIDNEGSMNLTASSLNNQGTVYTGSLVAIGEKIGSWNFESTIKNDTNGVINIEGNSAIGETVGSVLDKVAGTGLDGTIGAIVDQFASQTNLSVGYIQYGGSFDNDGQLIVAKPEVQDGEEQTTGKIFSAMINVDFDNSNVAAFEDLLSVNSTIINSGNLTADTLILGGGSLTNNAASEKKPAGSVTADSMIVVEAEINNGGTITVTGNTGMGELLKTFISDDTLLGLPSAGQGLVDGLFTEADKLSIGFVQVGGKLDNAGTLTANNDLSGCLSGLIGATVENSGTLSFNNLLGISSTVNNNADADLTADNLYLVGGQLTNKAEGTVTVNNSLIAIDVGATNTLIDNAGDITIKGSGTLGSVLTSLMPEVFESDIGGVVTQVLDMSALSAGYVQLGGKLNNTGNFTVEDGVSGLVNAEIVNGNTMSFNDMIVYQGTITNTNKFDADNLVVIDSTLTGDIQEGGHFTVGSLIVGGNTTNETDVTIKGQNQLGTLFVNAIGSSNLDQLGDVGAYIKDALNGADLKLGYAQIGGEFTNTGSVIVQDGVSGLVMGEIVNTEDGKLQFDEFVSYNGTIANEGQFSADTLIMVGGALTNKAGFAADSLVTVNSTLTNSSTLKTEGSVNLKGLKIGEFELPESLDKIEVGYAQIGGTATNTGYWDVNNALVVGGVINNANELNADKLFAYGSTITNTGNLTANWIAAAGEGQITNDKLLDADVMGVVGTGFENNADATIDSMLAVNSTVVNDGKLTTVAGVQLPGEVQDGIEQLAEQLGVDISGLDLDQHVELGYTQVGGSMVNNDAWTASNMVAVSGSITNNKNLTANGLFSVDTDITNKDIMDINGHLVMVDVNPETAMSQLVNGSADKTNASLTIDGAMTLAGVQMTNWGKLTTGDGTIDGTGSVASELVNKGTWNSTNLGMLGGSLVNDKDLTVEGLMTVAGTYDAENNLIAHATVVNNSNLDTTGAIKVEGLELDVGYLQLAGIMTNNKGAEWNTDHTALVGGAVVNHGQMTVNGQLLNVHADIVNTSTLNNTAGVAYQDIAADVGYLQAMGSMTNSGEWKASQIVALGGTISNVKVDEETFGSITTTGMTMIDTDLTNAGDLTVNGHFAMTEVERGELTKLTNFGNMTVTGAMALAGVKMENTGTLTTGDGVIDGSAALLSEMTNKGTWNSTNVGMAAGSVVNEGDKSVLNVSGLMTVVDGSVTNDGEMNTTGAVKVEGLELDVGYVQLAGIMTNNEGAKWNTDHTAIVGGSVENSGTMTVNGQLLNVEGDIVNKNTLNNTAGVAFGDLAANVGYLQGKGSMTNSGKWTASDIVALGGTISNVVDEETETVGSITTTGMTLLDTDLFNQGSLTVNGHFAMTEVERGELTKLTNSGTMTVTGAMALAGVKMENTGNLTTGDGVIDGSAALLSEMTNKGTWNSTNVGMVAGSLVNEGDKSVLNVSGLMTVAGGSVTNEGSLNTTGAVKVEGLELDVGYVQLAGIMTNNKGAEWNTDHTAILGGSVENGGTMTVNGQLLNVAGDIDNSGTLSTLMGVGFGNIEANVGYVQGKGSMTNSGDWFASQVVALGGSINNIDNGAMFTKDVTLADTDVKNEGVLTVNGHFAMTEVESGELTKLTNSGNMTITGAMALAGVKMENTGTLTTGDGVIDGSAALLSEMTNKGTWNSTNVGMAAGSLVNEGDKSVLNVSGLMTVAGGSVTNEGLLKTTGAVHVDGLDLDVGYVQAAGSMTNAGTWNTDHTAIVGGSVENGGTMTVNGQLLNVEGDIVNKNTLNNTAGVAFGDLAANVGYLQGKGSMTNSGKWTASDIVALGGTISNVKVDEVTAGSITTTGMTLLDTDLFNQGSLTVNGNFVMAESKLGDFTKLSNSGDMTVTGGMGLAGVDMVNTGTLTTGDGSIDGTAALATKMLNKGTWNTTNLGILAGTLSNEGNFNATGNVVVAGGLLDNDGTITIDGVLGVTGGVMHNNGTLTTGDGVIDGTAAVGALLKNDDTWNATNIGLVAGELINTSNAQLNVSKSVSITGGVFDNGGDVTVGEHLVVAGGVVTNANGADMTVQGVFGVTGGVLNNNGNLNTGDGVIDGTVAAGAALHNDGIWNASNIGVVAGTLTNNDKLTTTGHVTMAGGVITNTSDATMTVGGVLGITAGVLTNNGELKTGDGAIDGAAGALAYLNNNGKWTATNLGIDYGVLTNEGVLKASGTTYVGENGLLANGGEFSAKFLGVEGDFVNNGMTTTGLQLSTSTESSGNFAVAENAHVVNTGLIQSYGSVGVAGTVDLLSGAWTVQADANKGDVFFNDGSITGNGMLNLIGGVAVNTKDSTFDVGTLNLIGGVAVNTKGSTFDVDTLNLVDNATLYHGAESDSDFSGRLAGLYTDEALAKLKELAGIDVTTTTVKIDDAEVAVKVLSNTHSKNQLVVGQTLNVTNLNVGNSAMTLATNDKATFAQGSSTIIDVDSLGKDYAFESNGSELVVEDKAALVLQGVTHGGRYNVAQGFDLTDFGSSSGWQGDYLYAPEISGTGLKWVLDLDWGNGNVWVGAELESVGERHNVIHKNIIDNALRYVADNMTYSLRATPSATDMGFTRKIYRDLWMNFGVTRDMKVLVSNSLASIAQNVAVESLALDNVTDVVKSIEERVSFAGDVFRADGTMNELVADTHLWAHVLGSDRKQNGLNGAGGAVSIGYEAEDYGLIVGFDAANADKTARFGMAMSYIDGNATSNGSLLATTADYTTFGLHGYMNFTPNDKFNLIATVGLGRNSADTKMNLPQLAGWNYGQATADVDTTVFSAALRAETRFAFNNINVIPHAGLRMMMVDAGSYDTKVDGQTAFNNDVKMALIGQTPFGVTVKGQFEQSGWNVKPMADITFVTQFGDTESRTTTTVPGISVSDTYAAEFAGNFATTMSVGVEAEKGNCNVGLQLGVTKGQNDKTDTNFMAKVRYQF